MGKVVDGVELLRIIRDGELKSGTKIKRIDIDVIYYFNGRNIVDEHNAILLRFLDDINFIKMKFEILSEEDEEIDIEAIEEFDRPNINLHDLKDVEKEIKWLQDAHNELIKAVKQLYRMTKEEK